MMARVVETQEPQTTQIESNVAEATEALRMLTATEEELGEEDSATVED